jgi:nuclear transport factor 2 (NTF2) superfamily protein
MPLRAICRQPDRPQDSNQCFQRGVRRLIELRANDCAIDRQRDGFGILFALWRCRQQARNDGRHLLLIAPSDLNYFGQSATEFSDAVDEGATAKVSVAEPFSQSRCQSVHAFASAYATVALQRLDEPRHPALVPILQEFADENVFAGEMPIEGNLSNTGFCNHPIYTRGTNAFAVEEIMRSQQNTLARREMGSALNINRSHAPIVDRSVSPSYIARRRQIGLRQLKGSAMDNKPPLPPFTQESAALKVRLAEDAWNTRDPDRVVLVYTEDTRWRNRAEFPVGREQVRQFLQRKWARELDYRLIKELWAFGGGRIAVRFAYEWHDDSGQWFRSYGNENWEFDEHGFMMRRYASINDLPIKDSDRKFFWPLGRRPDEHPGLSDSGL